jgi:hypothetical protein
VSSYPPKRQQGYRKSNKPYKPKPFYARGAHIEEVGPEVDGQPDEEEDTSDLAIRTMSLTDDKKEKFLAEMRELDINF